MFEPVLFSRDKKKSFCHIVIVLPLLGAGHPLWMDCGGWLCVIFHPVKEFVCQEKCQEKLRTGDEKTLLVMDSAAFV